MKNFKAGQYINQGTHKSFQPSKINRKWNVGNMELKKHITNVIQLSGKRIIVKRKEIVEHPFGTIKRNRDYTYFMQKGAITKRS